MPSPTQLRGGNSESLAEKHLIVSGYRILARNWRGGGGELDRIAQDGEVLVFIEIRSRHTESGGTAMESIGFSKRRRVIYAALAYLSRFAPRNVPACRFDVVTVQMKNEKLEVEILKNAFDTEGVL